VAQVDLVVLAVPAVPVDQVASQIAQRDLAVPVVPVVPVEQGVLVALVAPVVPVAVVPVAVAPVHEEPPLVHSEGQEVVLHAVANLSEPSVKSLTTWKHLRWVEYACREEMGTVFDFRVAQV